ncbi:Zinc finger and SCAN domain-containing protein 29 [Frankliniella fusca]|uniref:Zinc finger and SCAN domain-containing protein 29 n=1 Tax=Frankliniella fusca TaxID=407009 RepID=A0AAE1HDD6_9NEOP|nr:Zinc finger and SCAN domain-containing protein 29 [Frankliniella fusca]
MVQYDLIDPESGNYWRVNISQVEANFYDLYNNHRARAIKELKDRKVPHTGKWDLSMVTSNTQANSPVPQGKKTVKNGNPKIRWPGNTSTLFINLCLPYRKWLRCKTVAPFVWEEISAKLLNKHNLRYNGEQCHAKMKSLKRTFREAKGGQHSGDKWPHYWVMTYIYDEPIVPGELSLTSEVLAVSNAVLPPEESPILSAGASGMNSDNTAVSFAVLRPVDSPILGAVASGYEYIQFNDDDNGDASIVPTAEPTLGILKDISNLVSNEGHISVPIENRPGMKVIAEIPLISDLSGPTSEAAEHLSIPDDGDVPDILMKEFPETQGMTEAPMTPTKKKAKGPAFLTNSPQRHSPQTTPRRKKANKPPKSALQLDPEDTAAFVAKCLARKADLQKERINVQVWKDISDELGDKFDWHLCRAKFMQMDESFKNTFLPLEGKMGSTEWPYYKSFCDIYDIPENYYSVVKIVDLGEEGVDENDDEEEKAANENDGPSKLWSADAMALLLSLYKTRQHSFESSTSHLRYTFLYAQISAAMKEAGYSLSMKQCKSKMDALKSKFRKEFDLSSKTGASPSSWPLYEKMLEMFEGSASLVPPYALSAGRALVFSEKGQAENSAVSATGTRTRPTLKTKAKTDIQMKKPIYKSWSQQMHDRNVRQREDLLKEVQIMNKNFEEGNKDRKLFFQAIMKKLQ